MIHVLATERKLVCNRYILFSALSTPLFDLTSNASIALLLPAFLLMLYCLHTQYSGQMSHCVSIANDTLHTAPVILINALIYCFLSCVVAPQPVGKIGYDFEMTSYNVSEDDGLVELSLQITSHSSIFCNITVNLTATNIEAGILLMPHCHP